MKKNKKGYSERRLWYFTCVVCWRKAQSHKRFKAENGECAVCRRNKVSQNQVSLFETQNESINTDKSDERERCLSGQEVQDA